MKPTKMIVNTQTQEISIVEMTDEEYEVYLRDQEESELGETL